MKLIVAFFSILVMTVAASAQTKLPELDKSPLDISYYPDSYPLLKLQDKVNEPLMARVIYSRPSKNGRSVFGGLIEYGKVWRLGANEATEIEFFQNVKVGNSKLKKGRYTIFTIPAADKWTFIINKDTDSWGSFKYDEKKDVARIEAPVMQQATPVEAFTLVFEKATAGFALTAAWDNEKVSLPISLQ